ncbi:MAG: hypothetical protein ABJP44_00570 [Sulfitobacter sp.]|uniref:hypothetical protein n=1 Tax=Sulfitobacter sp. TaxID=1903071 RepID=UPI003297F7BA
MMLSLCEWLSRRICRGLLGWDMTLCAYAWWRRDRGLWCLWVLTFDRVFRRDERDHCRSSYERRFPGAIV